MYIRSFMFIEGIQLIGTQTVLKVHKRGGGLAKT